MKALQQTHDEDSKKDAKVIEDLRQQLSESHLHEKLDLADRDQTISKLEASLNSALV